MAIQWPEENRDRFMIRMDHAEREHAVSGYGFVSVSDVTDLVADNEQCRREGEFPERAFRVWRLTGDGPVPVKVTTKGHLIPDCPMVEVILTWRVAIGGGKYATNSESGYYRMSEA